MQSNPYNPKKALWALLSDDGKKLSNSAKDAMTDAENRLSKREWAGDDTSYARAALYELDYWVSCTADVDAVKAALAHLKAALDNPNPPSALTQDADGSLGQEPMSGSSNWTARPTKSSPGNGRGHASRCFSNASTIPSEW